MVKTLHSTAIALSLLLGCSCATHEAPDSKAQALVETVAANHPEVVRLTVHAIPTGEKGYKAVASTLASKRGQPSDPEDKKAIDTGEVIVLEEAGGFDVTVPIRNQGGRHTAVVGVTLEASVERDRAIALSKTIAAEIERGWATAPMKK